MLSLRSIPLKNMKAHRARTRILMLLTFAQALCLFFGLTAVQETRRELLRSEARLGADLLVYPTAAVSKIRMDSLLMQGTPVEVYRNRSMLQRMDSCEGIAEVSYQIYLSDQTENGEKRWIIGFEPETDFVLSPWFETGSPAAVNAGAVAVGGSVAVSPENTVTLYGKQWQVTARLENTGSLLDEAVFAPMGTLRMLIEAAEEAGIDRYSSVKPESQFSAALVRVENREDLESVTNWINIYVRKVTAVSSEETLTDTASGIRSLMGVLPMTFGGIWLILLLALGMVQSILMKGRRNELSVWNSIGASGRLIRGVIMRESFLTHLLGAAAGILAAALAVLLFGSRLFTGPVPASSWLVSAAGTLVLAVLTGVLATGIALRKALKSLSGRVTLTL